MRFYSKCNTFLQNPFENVVCKIAFRLHSRRCYKYHRWVNVQKRVTNVLRVPGDAPQHGGDYHLIWMAIRLRGIGELRVLHMDTNVIETWGSKAPMGVWPPLVYMTMWLVILLAVVKSMCKPFIVLIYYIIYYYNIKRVVFCSLLLIQSNN